MEAGQNEANVLQNIVKCEGTRSSCALELRVSPEENCHLASPTLSCSPKRHLFDIQQEVTTPNTKRIKQETDDYGFYKDKEQLLLPSETSLKNIVSEVAYSLENNTCENILSIQSNSNFENASSTRSVQGDVIIVLDHTETSLKHLLPIVENTKESEATHENVEPLPYRADSRKERMSVPSNMDQVHFEPKRPILRALKSPDSRGNNGFAFDHNFFPKLVGVHSISSTSTATASPSTEIENHYDSQQTSELSLEKRGQCENINNPVTIKNNIDISLTDTSVSPRMDPTLINCRTPSPTQKAYDLLFTFTKKDGQSDMFLVVNEEVFAVSRYDHKGNSYLAHTDNNGKTSILARLPEEAETASRIVSNEKGGTGNALSSAIEQSRPTPSQRVASHYPTANAASVAVRSVQNRESAPANIVQCRIPRVIRGRENDALPNADYVSSEHQVVHGSRNGTFNLEKRQLSQRLDHLRKETAGHRQSELATDLSQWAPTDQTHLHPQTGGSYQPRHPVVGNDSLQTSTVHMNVHSSLTNVHVTLNGSRNQQLQLYQSTAGRNERHGAINTRSEQLFTNTATQGRYIGDTAVGNGFLRYSNKETNKQQTSNNMRYSYIATSPEDEKRIIYENKLMNPIAHQLSSSEEPSTANVSVNRRHEAANVKQSSFRTIVNESFARRVQAGTRGEVALHPQCHTLNAYPTAENADRHYTGKRNGPNFDNNFKIHDIVQRVPVNHMSRQDSDMLNLQPRIDSPVHNRIPRRAELQANDGTDSHNKVLEIITSWQRRKQRRSSSENDSLQLRELLLGATPNGVTGITTTAAEGTSSRETAERCRAAQTSTDTHSTPIISQVSCGVISRSTGGENVVPKRTATALVVDQGRSIYIDATDSVIDEEKRPRTAGQRCSNKPMNIGPIRINNTTIQQHYSNGVLNTQSRPASDIHSRVVQIPHQSKSLVVNNGQRCYTSKMLPRLTSKFDKRCVANKPLKDVVQTIKSPREGHGVPTHVSCQQSYVDVAQVYNNDVDEVVEIIINPPSKQVSQPKTIDHCKSAGKIGLSCTDGKPSQSTLAVSKPCDEDDDDDDVVEIIYETPKPNTTSDSQHISKVVLQSGPQICTEVRRRAEMAKSPPRHSKKVPLLKDQQSCTDGSPLKRLFQAKSDEVVNSFTITSKEDNRPDTANNHEHKDKYAIICGQQISSDEMPSQSSVSTKTDEDEVAVMTNLPANQYSGPDTTECSEKVEKDKSHLEKYILNGTELKNIQQRDELLKKIKNTQERMTQEQIDWKKKYLFRLEVQLKKKLAKIPDATEHAQANNENE